MNAKTFAPVSRASWVKRPAPQPASRMRSPSKRVASRRSCKSDRGSNRFALLRPPGWCQSDPTETQRNRHTIPTDKIAKVPHDGNGLVDCVTFQRAFGNFACGGIFRDDGGEPKRLAAFQAGVHVESIAPHLSLPCGISLCRCVYMRRLVSHGDRQQVQVVGGGELVSQAIENAARGMVVRG